MRIKRVMYVALTWPFNDRDGYNKWIGAQVPIPAWVLIGLALLAVYVICTQL
jgi:hypothetical protein